MLQAPPTWNNVVPIPNAEADTIIHRCWKTKTDLMAKKRKYFGFTYIFISKPTIYPTLVIPLGRDGSMSHAISVVDNLIFNLTRPEENFLESVKMFRVQETIFLNLSSM
jgi:hypothetical protein